MKTRLYKKILAAAALGALVLILLPITPGAQLSLSRPGATAYSGAPGTVKSDAPLFSLSPKLNLAEASGTPSDDSMDWYACGTHIFTCTMYGISYFMKLIVGFALNVIAAFLLFVLSVSGNLFDTSIVQVGFSVCLAFANLGFVLGIILIAIATILRNQTYGLKQILWKLVVMAILINFGLVITRPVVSIADDISNYFISSMGGSNSGFVTALVANFNPQLFAGGSGVGTGATGPKDAAAKCGVISQIPNVATTNNGGLAGGAYNLAVNTINRDVHAVQFICGAGNSIASVTSWATNQLFGNNSPNGKASSESSSDVYVQQVISLIFNAIFLAFILFVLLALAVLLVIRYIYLAFLLILIPFAWLAWVFPGTKNHFEKWLHKFLSWTFFPALSFFFIYLTLLFYQSIDFTTQMSAAAESVQVTVAFAALSDIVMCGFMIGSLIAANSLGIAGASTAISFGKSAAKWVGGKTGGIAARQAARQGKKVAARAVPENVKQKLQSGGYQFIPKRLQVAAGVGLGNVQKAGGSKLVDQESGWAKEQGKDVDAAARMLGSGGLSEAKKFALLKELNNNHKFDPTKIKSVDGQSTNAFLQDKNRFGKYGQENLRDDLNMSASGASSTTVAAATALAAQGPEARIRYDGDDVAKGADGLVSAFELLQKSLEKTARNMDKNDIKKQNLNYMYSSATLADPSARGLRLAQIKALINAKPQLIAAHLPGMSRQQVDNFSQLFAAAITQERVGADEATQKRLDQIQGSFDKSYLRNIMGLIPEEDEEKKTEDKAPAAGGEKK